MQRSTYTLDLEKDKEKPQEKWHLNMETEEPTCDLKNNNSDSVSWKLPAIGPPRQVGRMESPSPEAQHPQSLSKKHFESHGNLLQFDRQAPGRISTSPTLRRLRGSVWGASHSQLQQNALAVPTCGNWRDAGSSPCLSKSLPGSPKDSSHFLSPLRSHTRLPSNPGVSIKSTDTVQPQNKPTDEDALPALQPIRKASLDQASSSGLEGPTLPSPTLQYLDSQVMQ
ncbi:uncharacterized protein C12orf74 homolog [Nannospalax galili]|uniref:uncharacterized protein C12orf74 homolog n=1 Tax=Nannospalax galili TaxID=1026970 RepID=UPI0004ED0407|nr:uncharacterized protein C12orf74 homolog [Nannospalax galili]